MGTLFFTDAMHPSDNRESDGEDRQVEIYRPSGEDHLVLRIGEPGHEHQGSGPAVKLSEESARELVSALLKGMRYLGFNTGDLD